MATQVSYPGIYIQEFTPGAPIQGVGTSTAAFIGTASMGPVNQPTMLTSWDEFQNVFGGFISEPPNSLTRSWLAPAVYGFFLNQGTNCYVVRAAKLPSGVTSLMAALNLPDQPVSPNPVQTALVVTAIAEGSIGNSISVTVRNSSRLAAMLSAGGPALTAETPLVPSGQTKIQVSLAGLPSSFVLGNSFPNGSPINVTSGTTTEVATVQSTSIITPGVLGEIDVHSGLTNAYSTAPTITPGPTLQATAPLAATQLTFNVTLPPAPSTFVLSQALPTGAVIQVTSGGTSEFVTVASAGVTSPGLGFITLTSGLANSYASAPTIASFEFDLVVTAATTETWPQLSMNPFHPGYWGSVVDSQWITLSLPSVAPSPVPPNPNPAPGSNLPLKNGLDDNRAADLAEIDADPTAYLNLLMPLQDVDIVAIPGNVTANTQQALVTHCETLFNRFAVLDAVQDTAVGFPNLLAQYGQVRTPNGFAAIYFPWIQVVNPLTGATEYWPPSGHVIGIYAQTDQTYGVYKAPANVPVAGALGLQSLLTNADQGPLNLLGINILRVFPEQSQPLVWGARTTSTDSDWQYVNIRRLFIYLEQSIEQGIRWAVFAPNNTMLWGSLKRTITEFLNRVQGDGGIISFYVRIDAALNPPATQALGQLFIEVGIQPTYPAEFIILKIGIWQGGSSVTES